MLHGATTMLPLDDFLNFLLSSTRALHILYRIQFLEFESVTKQEQKQNYAVFNVVT